MHRTYACLYLFRSHLRLHAFKHSGMQGNNISTDLQIQKPFRNHKHTCNKTLFQKIYMLNVDVMGYDIQTSSNHTLDPQSPWRIFNNPHPMRSFSGARSSGQGSAISLGEVVDRLLLKRPSWHRTRGDTWDTGCLFFGGGFLGRSGSSFQKVVLRTYGLFFLWKKNVGTQTWQEQHTR